MLDYFWKKIWNSECTEIVSEPSEWQREKIRWKGKLEKKQIHKKPKITKRYAQMQKEEKEQAAHYRL